MGQAALPPIRSQNARAFGLAGFAPLTAARPQTLKECLDAKGIILQGKNGILSHRAIVRRERHSNSGGGGSKSDAIPANNQKRWQAAALPPIRSQNAQAFCRKTHLVGLMPPFALQNGVLPTYGNTMCCRRFSRLPSRPNKRGSPNGLPLLFGWDGRIRTYEYQSQSLVPYRLATSQYQIRSILYHLRHILSRVIFEKMGKNSGGVGPPVLLIVPGAGKPSR